MTRGLLSGDLVGEMEVLRSLLEVGAKLYSCRDQRQVLGTILCEARKLARAEAGSLYLVKDDRLAFVAVQNDRMDSSVIAGHLLGKEMPISMESLAGFVALTGEITSIPDSHALPTGLPFRINRDFDAKTGYRVQSILAIPLNCPDGTCAGVLQLFNRLDENGNAVPFPTPVGSEIISLASTAAIAVHNAQLQEQLRQVHLNTIFRLSTIAEYRDADTSEHIHRVSRCSELVANAMSLDAEEVELVKYASPMHDVGKVAIPDAILLKPGHLTPAQRRVMQRHTSVGAEIFDNPQDDVIRMAQEVALCHHERWDGQGYPKRLKRDSIPLSGRIVGLADVFDAIVSRRCYKESCPLDVALDIIDKDRGTHFDPAVAEAFLGVLDDVLEIYPLLKAG